MNDNKKQKGNWYLLLVGVVLGSVITIGAFWVIPLDFNKAKNSVIHTVKNINWGFRETKVITTTTEKDEKGKITKTTESEQPQSGKTVWDFLDLSSRLAVPILLFTLGYQLQKRDKEKEKEEQDRRKEERKKEDEREQKRAERQAELEREIAQDNLAEEAIQR